MQYAKEGKWGGGVVILAPKKLYTSDRHSSVGLETSTHPIFLDHHIQ